jgi:hypothetical protein
MDSETIVDKKQLKIDVLQALHFTLTAWRQVKQSTVVNCFKKCGYTSVNPPSEEQDEQVEVSEEDWLRLDAGINFNNFVTFDDDIPTCGVETIETLCDASLNETVEEDDVDEDDPLPAPSFSEACKMFEGLKTFFYSHSITDTEKNLLCNTERMLMSYGTKTTKKQMTMKDYFM